MLKIEANAKINLFLDILGKFDSGYHSLFMVMQSVSLADTVTLEITGNGKTEIVCSDSSLPCDRRNLAYKAADAFFDAAGIRNEGLRISIDKRIPFAAGLAGGSADAAAVINGLDRLLATELPREKLLAAGLSVGSDVPFCMTGGTMLVQNLGDVLSPLPALASCYCVLIKPDYPVSTAQAYGAYDKAKHIYHPNCVNMLHCAASGDTAGICANAGNVFEQVVEVYERVEIKAIMRRHNALMCQMSGSGPTVFGLFEQKSAADACARELKKLSDDVFVCSTATAGTVIK